MLQLQECLCALLMCLSLEVFFFMFLIYLKTIFVILYTDDGSHELGPNRMDFVKLGSVVE